MSVSAAAAPAPPEPVAPRSGRARASWRLPLLVAAGLLVLSLAIVLWARTRPGFDPYGWLVWGHQTIAGSLNTNAAPSWKPLPYLFTVPYGLFGHYELWLWMVTAVAVALAGPVFAARITYRLVLSGEDSRRRAALLAGAFAAVALLGIRDYWHYILSAQSDPMVVSLCLGALDSHLSGRRRTAFWLGVLASLARPEVWPFLGLYAIWGWRSSPQMRLHIVGGLAVLLALWFGIPALTSRSPFVAGTNALGSGRALHSDKVYGTIDRFLDMHETALEIAALLSVAVAVWRRERTLLALAGGAAAWVVLEVAFSLHGWPGLQRYMFAAGGVMVVLAAVLFGRLVADLPRISRGAGFAGVLLAGVLVVGLVPGAVSRARVERRDLRVQHLRTTEINRLGRVITSLGGASRFARCGEPLTRLEYQTILAWELHVNVASVGFKYDPAIHSRRPIVLFTPTHRGWKVQALHQRSAACRTLPR